MAERKPKWPKVGNLIIATKETTDNGAFAKFEVGFPFRREN